MPVNELYHQSVIDDLAQANEHIKQLEQENARLSDEGRAALSAAASVAKVNTQLVHALEYAKDRLEVADEDKFDPMTIPIINAALKAAGAE